MKLQEWAVDCLLTERQFREMGNEDEILIRKQMLDGLKVAGVMPQDVHFLEWQAVDQGWCAVHDMLAEHCAELPGDHELKSYRLHRLVAIGTKPAPGDDTEEPG